MTLNRCISVSDAYFSMLKNTLRESPFMQVSEVMNPILGDKINNDAAFELAFQSFKFPDGRYGASWIRDRILALFDEKGEYWKPLHRFAQLDYAVSALDGMRKGNVPRWNANRLIITLFDPSQDLHNSRAPTPPCLISLCFYPMKQKLTLIATFRAQYTDAKGYGNLISLAMLLKDVSEKTDFVPFKLYSVAQKAILKYPQSTAKQLFNKLLVAKESR